MKSAQFWVKLLASATSLLSFRACAPLLAGTKSDTTNTKPYLILVTQSGRNITVEDRTANLQGEAYFNASDPIHGALIHGLWLFYSDKNYNWEPKTDKGTNGKVEWAFNKDPNKFHEFSSDIESFRTPGDPDDFSISTFNLYMGLNFTGPDHSTEDTESYDIPFAKAKSLIITGPDPWYLYTSANFVQKTLCVHTSADARVALISDYYLNPYTKPLRHISSARKNGCTASTRARHLYYPNADPD